MSAKAPGGAAEPPLSDFTTLRTGGPVERLVVADTDAELIEAVAAADAAGETITILGGGSNVVVSDDGLPGTVALVRTRGIDVSIDSCSGAWVTVAAGEPWDDLVARAVAAEWSGVEALSGIPGLTGGTPIQNVGAYGQEVADTIARVTAYDRVTSRTEVVAAGDCAFGYRTSRFKANPGRYVVLSVTFQLPLGSMSAPIGWPAATRPNTGSGSRSAMPPGRRRPRFWPGACSSSPSATSACTCFCAALREAKPKAPAMSARLGARPAASSRRRKARTAARWGGRSTGFMGVHLYTCWSHKARLAKPPAIGIYWRRTSSVAAIKWR